ncbi:MAG: PDDEXK nuclease domain-containing protein [Candidatus Firestonebacteria bacterium]
MTLPSKISNYDNILNNISEIIECARKKTIRQINTIITQTYWEIGKIIVEEEQKGRQRARYGEYLIKRLSDDLVKKFGKGFTTSNLKNMRQFYLVYLKLYVLRGQSLREKRYALRSQLSWTHFRILMRVENETARKFYELETVKNNWSTRELDRQINSLLFERISLSKDKKGVLKLAQKGQVIEKPEDAVKDPYVLEFLGISERHQFKETQLEQALIDHLQEFILELGKGFTFVARQKRITVENEHFYIDLVFYNYILKCFVIIDLKLGKLMHQDIGQMDFYVRYVEKEIKQPDDNPTIGIILCSDKNQTMVKYTLLSGSKRIFASKYKLYLPTKEELKREIELDRSLIETYKKLREQGQK